MAPVLCYWSPDLPMTVETDASDQAITAILLVTTPDTEICPVAFSSHSLQGAECNYDTHDKELLAIFQAYKNWCHDVEGSAKVIDKVTNHKNLEYFMTTKKLTQRQGRWSEYLSHFNTQIRFQPGRLGVKPDTLTRRWDVYLGDGKTSNSTANTQPFFLTDQLATTNVMGQMNSLTPLTLPLHNVLDHNTISKTISSFTKHDTFAQSIVEKLMKSEPPTGWTRQTDHLYFDGCPYVPDQEDLHLQIIRNHHNHPTAGHFGQTKTIKLIKRSFH